MNNYYRCLCAVGRYSFGLSYRQVALVIGKPKSTVYNHTCQLAIWQNMSTDVQIAAHNVFRFYKESANV